MLNRRHTVVNNPYSDDNEKILKQIRRKCRANIADWTRCETNCDDKFHAIHFACYFGKADLVRSLHRYGADLTC